LTLSADAAPLRHTPLYDLHRERGARMVAFAGYEMPVQYPAGIIAEHLHTRSKAGLFDVSHMGQLRLAGAAAAGALEALVPGDLEELAANRMRYTLLLDERGGILDDLMVTRQGDGLMLVVNAARKEADTALLRERLDRRVSVEPLSQALPALERNHLPGRSRLGVARDGRVAQPARVPVRRSPAARAPPHRAR